MDASWVFAWCWLGCLITVLVLILFVLPSVAGRKALVNQVPDGSAFKIELPSLLRPSIVQNPINCKQVGWRLNGVDFKSKVAVELYMQAITEYKMGCYWMYRRYARAAERVERRAGREIYLL